MSSPLQYSRSPLLALFLFVSPVPAQVPASEFLADIGAFQLGEALAYAVNVEPEFDAREAIKVLLQP